MTRRAVVAALTLALCAGACSRSQGPREDVRIVPQVKPIQPRRVAFAPNDENRLLVLEAAGLVGVWDIRDVDKPVRTAWIPAAAIDACFSADGTEVITAGRDGKLRWWASVGGQPLRTSTGGHQGPARALAVAGDQVLSGGEDGTLRLWNRDGTPRGEPITAHDGFVVSVAVSDRGDLASAGIDETIRLWQKDPSSPNGYRGRVLYQEEKSKRRLYLADVLKGDPSFGWDHAVAFAPGANALAAAAFDGGVRLWPALDWGQAKVLNLPGKHHVRALSWSLYGDVLAAAGFDGKVARWDAAGASLGEGAQHSAPIVSVALSPSGARFATASSDDRLRLWRSDGSLIALLPDGAPSWSTTVALTAEGPVFASIDGTGNLRRFAIDGSTVHESPTGTQHRVTAIALSPSGDLLVAAHDDQSVALLGPDGATTAKSKLWSYPDGAAVSPRADVVALAGNPGNVELLNADGTPRTAPFRACREKIFGLAFSPVDETLAILCEDDGAKLWTLDGRPRGTLLEPQTAAAHRRGLAFSASADLLASGDRDGAVDFWALPARRLDDSLWVGLPIDQVGLHRGGSWVSANGNTVFFFDPGQRLVATAVVAPEGVIAFLPDGSFAGSAGVEGLARAFRADGTPLSAEESAERVAPRSIGAALRTP